MAGSRPWFCATLQQMEAEYITAEDLRKKLCMNQHGFVDYLKANRKDLRLVFVISDGRLFHYSPFSDDETDLFYDADLEEAIGRIASHEIAIHRDDISAHSNEISKQHAPPHDGKPKVIDPVVAGAWEGAIKAYASTHRDGDALPRRMRILLGSLSGKTNAQLAEGNQGANIPRDLKQARESDVQVLLGLYPHLPPLSGCT